mgnify:CR=1 FL=1
MNDEPRNVDNLSLNRAARTGKRTEDERLLEGPEPNITPFHKTDTWRVMRIMGEFVEGFDALAELERAPHAGLQLKGYEGRYFRVRVADWRIVYTIEEDRLIVVVVELAHRREVYERLQRRG